MSNLIRYEETLLYVPAHKVLEALKLLYPNWAEEIKSTQINKHAPIIQAHIDNVGVLVSLSITQRTYKEPIDV